ESREGQEPADRSSPNALNLLGRKERVMGLEPTTATLATWRSTTELHPHDTSVEKSLPLPPSPEIIKRRSAISRGAEPDGMTPLPTRLRTCGRGWSLRKPRLNSS